MLHRKYLIVLCFVLCIHACTICLTLTLINYIVGGERAYVYYSYGIRCCCFFLRALRSEQNFIVDFHSFLMIAIELFLLLIYRLTDCAVLRQCMHCTQSTESCTGRYIGQILGSSRIGYTYYPVVIDRSHRIGNLFSTSAIRTWNVYENRVDAQSEHEREGEREIKLKIKKPLRNECVNINEAMQFTPRQLNSNSISNLCLFRFRFFIFLLLFYCLLIAIRR